MLINHSVISEVRETLGDDTFRVFVGRLLQEVAETQATLLRQLDEGDFDALARTAHRTSGSAASIGATALHAALKDIENTARTHAANNTLSSMILALPALADQTRDGLFSAVPG